MRNENSVHLLIGMMDIYRKIIDDRIRSYLGFGRYDLSNPRTEDVIFPEARMVFREITGHRVSEMHIEITEMFNDTTEAQRDI